MLTAERKERILTYVDDHNSADVSTLAARFNVSEVTIRRDLNELEEKGLIHRVHGGAQKINILKSEPFYLKKLKENSETKRKIALKAMEFVSDGSVIFLDAGTTVFEITKEIIARAYKNLTLITNDINTAGLIHSNSDADLIIMGGNVVSDIGNIEGALSHKMLEQLRPEILFMGASSIGKDLKIYSPDEEKVVSKNLLLQISSKKILAVDKSKFNKTSIYYINDADHADFIITDYLLTEKQRELLKGKTKVLHV